MSEETPAPSPNPALRPHIVAVRPIRVLLLDDREGNLTCTGCGRIREYSTNLKDMVPLEKCLAAAMECDAPMVSICGGEPLIYPKIEALVAGLLEQNRV